MRVRNTSEFNSNMQFQSDAEECGFSIRDLGGCRPFTLDGWKGYEWKPPLKDRTAARLVEFGRLHLEGTEIPGRRDRSLTSSDMFKLMEKAQYEEGA